MPNGNHVEGTKRPQAEQSRTALILYGSETGNAQDVAEEIARMAQRLRFETTVLDMESIQLRDVLKFKMVIFALSTTGQGEMPQNARSFWKTLLSNALKPGVLRRMRFTSFGLGDSSYPRYNVSHRMLCGRLTQLGARSFCGRGEGNEQHPEGHSAGFREWIVRLKRSILETFPLAESVQPMADDEFLKPKWKLVKSSCATTLTDNPKSSGSNGMDHESRDLQGNMNGLGNPVMSEVPSAKSENQDRTPSRDPVPMIGSFSAELKSNDRVTLSTHFQDVRLLDMRLETPYTYGPGAVAVVYPKNFPADVDEFISLMHWEDIADVALDVARTHPTASSKILSPSPLKHLDISNVELTLRWLLENVLDIMSIPRRSFFSNLAYFASTQTDDEQYQKERLLELANPELIDELWDYTTRPKRTILEVMMDFTTIQIPWQYALSLLPIMRGRQFSIASGGAHTQDGKRRTKIELLVAIADPPSPIIKYRRRYGVCTRYIATLQPGQRLNIGMQQGYLDVQPNEIEVPVVMIGPGTGVAPMRSMIHQRKVWAEEMASTPTGKHLAQDILFFGCRSSDDDYFFRSEWASLSQSSGLQVIPAFSRDKKHPKRYVQDQIHANAAAVFEALHTRGGKLYVCGSSGNMPKGVREALLDVLVEQGKMEREHAEAYLDGMEKTGRYKQETW